VRSGLLYPLYSCSIIITISSAVLLPIVINFNFNSFAIPCRRSLSTEARWDDANNIARIQKCFIAAQTDARKHGQSLDCFVGGLQQTPGNITWPILGFKCSKSTGSGVSKKLQVRAAIFYTPSTPVPTLSPSLRQYCC
jgi:hypothetical protein